MHNGLTRRSTSSMRRLDRVHSPRSTHVVGGNVFKKIQKGAKQIYNKGRKLYEQADKHATKARQATHNAVSAIREQVSNVSSIAAPFVGAEKAAELQNQIDSKISPYLNQATAIAKTAEDIQGKVRQVADLYPTKAPPMEEGGAFYQTGYEHLGKGFEQTGGNLKRKIDAAIGRATKRIRGPYGKLKQANMLAGIREALNTIKNALPKSEEPIKVELKSPEDAVMGSEQKEDNTVAEAVPAEVEESYGGLISANLPAFKNQIQAFAALIADRIAADLSENIDNDPKFVRVLTNVIAGFMKVFDETGGVIPDEMFELKKRTQVAKASGGRFTAKGVEKFGKKAYNTVKTILNDAGTFVKEHPELLAAAALI